MTVAPVWITGRNWCRAAVLPLWLITDEGVAESAVEPSPTVECLDDLNSEKDYRYVWQTTRLHTNY